MKKLLMNKSFRMLVSAIAAVLIWVGVMNIANPTVTVTRDLPIEVVNSAVLENAELTYEIVGADTARVEVRVRSRDQYKIKNTDFRCYADLSDLYDVTGAIPIHVDVLNNADILESAPYVRSPEVLKIITEALQTKVFGVQVYTRGNLGDGYILGKASTAPGTVTLKGPVSQVGRINSVGVEVQLAGNTSDVTGEGRLGFYDANRNLLDLASAVTADKEDISYTQEVMKVSTVPVKYVVKGTPAEGYRFTGIASTINEMTICGRPEDVDQVSGINVTSPALDLENASAGITEMLDLASYLPSGITPYEMDNTKAEVSLQVEALTTRRYTVDNQTLLLSGAREGYTYDVLPGTLEITVRGLRGDLDTLSPEKMELTLPVGMLEDGIHNVRPATSLDDTYTIVNMPAVTVEVFDNSIVRETDESGRRIRETGETGETSGEDEPGGENAGDEEGESASEEGSSGHGSEREGEASSENAGAAEESSQEAAESAQEGH